MTLFERVKLLAEERGKSLQDIASELNFGVNTFYRWKKSAPSADNLKIVADYFDVSTDYLLGRSEKRRYYDLTEKDKIDIGEEVDRALNGSGEDDSLNFYGEPISKEDMEKIRDAMIIAYELSRKEAKKKFTPKKYKD